MQRTAQETRAALRAAAKERILVLDGAMGTMIQDLKLSEADFRGEIFKDHGHDQKGNNDILILSQPEAIRDIHLAYFLAGADICETNTFSSTSIAQADYGCESYVHALNRDGARLARQAADMAQAKDGRRRFVAPRPSRPTCPIPAIARSRSMNCARPIARPSLR
jgi:5-methyltetrahydrofolate--homocysteine methyltransferase